MCTCKDIYIYCVEARVLLLSVLSFRFNGSDDQSEWMEKLQAEREQQAEAYSKAMQEFQDKLATQHALYQQGLQEQQKQISDWNKVSPVGTRLLMRSRARLRHCPYRKAWVVGLLTAGRVEIGSFWRHRLLVRKCCARDC